MTHEANLFNSRVQPMIWGTNPRTYHLPERETNVNSKDVLNVGDILKMGPIHKFYYLTIVKIISVSDSSLSGYSYYRLLTTKI